MSVLLEHLARAAREVLPELYETDELLGVVVCMTCQGTGFTKEQVMHTEDCKVLAVEECLASYRDAEQASQEEVAPRG